MNENHIMHLGERIKTGLTPSIVTQCGFASPDEVRRAAAKNSQGTPKMKMSDVAEWFKDMGK